MSLESVSRVGFADTSAVAKPLAELQGLTISGPLTGATGGTAIAVPESGGIEFEDTIIKCLENNAGTLTDRTAHTTIVDRRATGTATILNTLADGDQLDVNGKLYTFTEMEESFASNVGPQIIPFQLNPSGVADVDVVAARLAKVIMSSDSGLTASAVGPVVTITNRAPGVVGNSVELSSTGSPSLAHGHITCSNTTLLGGTATNAIKISDSTSGHQVLLFWFNKQ